MRWFGIVIFAFIFVMWALAWFRRYLFLKRLTSRFADLVNWEPKEDFDESYVELWQSLLLMVVTSEKEAWAKTKGITKRIIAQEVSECHLKLITRCRQNMEADFSLAGKTQRSLLNWYGKWGNSQSAYRPEDFYTWLDKSAGFAIGNTLIEFTSLFLDWTRLSAGRGVSEDMETHLFKFEEQLARWPRREKAPDPLDLDCVSIDLPPETPEDEAETERIIEEVNVMGDRAKAEAARVCAKFALPGSDKPEAETADSS